MYGDITLLDIFPAGGVIRVGKGAIGALKAGEKLMAMLSRYRSAREAFQVAKQGGRHSGHYNTFLTKSTGELQKSVRNYEKQVDLHLEKIANPEKYADRWGSMLQAERDGLIKKWEKDAKRNQELADVMRGILRERGVR